ncbi:MAG: trehalase family glycosidase, partial [Acutalibacteraceae bacterium]
MSYKKSKTKRVLSLFLAILLSISTAVTVAITVNAENTYKLYVRGDFNSWGATDDYLMNYDGNGEYSATIVFPAGTYQYKLATEDWSTVALPSGDNATFTIGDKCQVVFKCNPSSGTYSASPASVYTAGDLSGVIFTSNWYEHNDAVLALADNNMDVIYVSNKDSKFSEYNTSWNLISTGNGDGVYYLQNVKTEGYVYADGENAYCSEDGNSTDSGKWLVDTSTGTKRFLNYANRSYCLNIEDLGDVVKVNSKPSNYTSTQWRTSYTEYDYTLYPDKVIDTESSAKATSGTSITSSINGINKSWNLTKDISDSPVFTAPNTPLAEAVYNLSMEEIYYNQFQSTYGTAFYTGTAWQKVWTRDTAMSCQYSLAWIFPDISYNCQREKVVGGEGSYTFEQDTGTGGSYPVSTDKIITMISVWETYLANGDKSRLEYFYDICANTIAQDLNVAYDKKSGLFNGETCGLDWRDQTYPDWTSAETTESLSNIAESKATSVNAIYCEVARIMSRAADILNKGEADVKKYKDLSESLEKAISTRLWDSEKGLYASWEYPEYMGSPLAKKYDVIGNGYALWFGIGTDEQLKSIAENYPLISYGAETCSPQKEGIYTYGANVYHNKSVWPGWQATLMIGANYAGNEKVASECWNGNVRAAAINLTNKEVVDYLTGEGSASDRQLWSIAGTLGGYYRVLYGMNYTEEGITFDPYVPDWMEGPFTLSNYKYRDADLEINLSGKGDKIVSIMVDGALKGDNYVFPAEMSGKHTIDIVMTDSGEVDKANLDNVKNHVVCPPEQKMTLSGNTLSWTP